MKTSAVGEPVRLVVWDLDDTLWRGTLDDVGVIEHIEENYELIRELNRRGIMNSVCSKNSFENAREVLEEQGIWNELVFPSIDWSPKGARLVELVALMQLRPQSVLFIDDNDRNLAEAQAMVPGIQIAGPDIIKGLLDDVRLKGSNDPNLVRLAHYKILKKRHEGLVKANGDNLEFLRQSGIEVIFDYDIEENIDRAIELINRTNQLNFTKFRLPEELDAARRQLREMLARHNVKAALIKVKDVYGDHGYCGFYVLEGSETSPTLLHFCFSCRIMGMGIEQRLFQFLGRPRLDVVGETASDVKAPLEVDWITFREAEDNGDATRPTQMFSEVRLRGGCELSSVGHYFNLSSKSLMYETNYVRKHIFFMRDSTTNLLSPFKSGGIPRASRELGIEDWEYESKLFDKIDKDGLIIVSMWGDVVALHYRDKEYRDVIANNLRNMWENGIEISEDDIEKKFLSGQFNEEFRHETLKYISIMKERLELHGRLSADEIAEHSYDVARMLPSNVPTYFIMPSRFWMLENRKKIKFIPSISYNLALNNLSSLFPNVKVTYIDDFIEDDKERHEGFRHFDRIVYYRLYRHIMSEMSSSWNDGVEVESARPEQVTAM